MTNHERIQRERDRLLRLGWTERDLDEYVRRHGDGFLFALRELPPVVDSGAGGVDPKVLRRVRALLAKAEATSFADEADAFSAKAQELMARHRIEHLGSSGDGPGGRRVWLDAPYVAAKAILLMRVARANGCRGVHLPALGCVHIVGFPDDLEATEVLFTSLLVQATREAVGAGPQVDGRGRSRTRSYRNSFLRGFAWRIGERLRRTTASVGAERPDLLPVLARRDDEVEAAIEQAFPRTTAVRGSMVNAEGWGAGVAAADRADVGRDRVGGPAGQLAG